jgi:hypothetical protein
VKLASGAVPGSGATGAAAKPVKPKRTVRALRNDAGEPWRGKTHGF